MQAVYGKWCGIQIFLISVYKFAIIQQKVGTGMKILKINFDKNSVDNFGFGQIAQKLKGKIKNKKLRKRKKKIIVNLSTNIFARSCRFSSYTQTYPHYPQIPLWIT